MSKYQTFEDLQGLGTEKIHERTHISRDKLELLLTKSYGDVGRVQFMGFLSILEREYGIDLNDIRHEYTAYMEEHAGALPPKESVILQPKSDTKKKWVMAGGVLIAALMGGGYVLQSLLTNMPHEEVMSLTTLAIEPAVSHETNVSVVEESNMTAQTTAEPAAAENNGTAAAISGENTVTIRPRYKVWAGMIDMASGEKTQQITGDPIVIDTAWSRLTSRKGKKFSKKKIRSVLCMKTAP